MLKEKYTEIFDKVYRLTDNTTPRSFDCGELCGKRCCSNLSSGKLKSGMALLPHEKDYLISKGAKYEYAENEDGDILICNGSCNRKLRPFACRIFPYYADLRDNRIKIKKDLRAVSVCPLILMKIRKRPSVYFLRNIKKSIRVLCTEEEIKDNFDSISGFIEYLYDLYAKMEK